MNRFLQALCALIASDTPPPRPTPPRARDAAAETPPGCGWFDSSHELRRGLLVREHEPQQAQWTAQGIIAISSN